MGRAIILVLDSFGIGATADADKFGDTGSDTFGHIAEARAAAGTPLALPNLARLGLFHAGAESTGRQAAGAPDDVNIIGAYGHAKEMSSGKDTPSGHWEIAGVPVMFDWGYFTDKTETFPQALLDQLKDGGRLVAIVGDERLAQARLYTRHGETVAARTEFDATIAALPGIEADRPAFTF